MRCRRREHGLSTFAVIGIMGLVAMTFLAITRHFAVEARRTQRYTAEAQVRELLLAGEAMVRTGVVSEGQVTLPQAMADSTLSIEREGEAYVITATLGERVGRQRVTYHRNGDTLVLDSAVLEALP